MAEEYVIIRVQRAPRRRRRGLGFDSDSAKPAADSLAVMVVTSREAAAEAPPDPDVKARARLMPMQLIAPVAIVEVAAEPAIAGSVSKTPWGIRAVRADTSPFDGRNIVVAVLDTGIDRTHPAFTGVELIEKDFTGEGNGDSVGHGTHCAATIFGRDVNGMRIGIARGVTRALIGKVIGTSRGSTAGIASAIFWAAENGANVISMSLGMDFPGYQADLQLEGMRSEPATSLALEAYRENLAVFDSIARLVESLTALHGPCLLIAAAGNESRRAEAPPYKIAASPPAVSTGFVSVAALGEGPDGLTVAPFSNTRAKVSAPGVGVISAKVGGGLVSMDGTSMATPHVAGVAALWAQKLEQEGGFTASQFAARLEASATRSTLKPASTSEEVGAGIVQAPQD